MMTKEEVREAIKEAYGNSEYADEIIKALEQEPYEDYISRQALLKLMGEEPFNWTDSDKELQEVEDYRNFRNIVEQLPSVNPQPKTGHWIKTGYVDKVMCSICKRKMWNFWEVNDFNYCPNCGAKMVEPQESNDGMTSEEAKELLDNLIGMVSDNHESDYDTALKMGIKALEQEPCEDCIARQPLIDNWNHCADMLMGEGDAEVVMEWIFDAPSVTSQSYLMHHL